MKRIEFAVIQSGHAVFGTGETREQAISDAAYWLEDEHGRRGGFTPEQVEALIKLRPNDGDLMILHSGDDEFDDYLSNCGFVFGADGNWYDEHED